MRAIRDPADAAQFAAMVVRRHVPDPAYRVFLFGSRAAGSAAERSDIDIGIEGPPRCRTRLLPRSETSSTKHRPFITIDVVDFARVPDKFRRVARERIPL